MLEKAVTARLFLVWATAGFVASAALHLATFTPLEPPVGDAPALALFAGAFVPLLAMLARLRRARAPIVSAGRFRVYSWRALASLVPERIRVLAFGMILYVLMNLVLSLALGGGATATVSDGKLYLAEAGGGRREVSREEYAAHRRLTGRLLSGHLLLFFLVPLIYFRFVDPRLAELGAAASQGGRP